MSKHINYLQHILEEQKLENQDINNAIEKAGQDIMAVCDDLRSVLNKTESKVEYTLVLAFIRRAQELRKDIDALNAAHKLD